MYLRCIKELEERLAADGASRKDSTPFSMEAEREKGDSLATGMSVGESVHDTTGGMSPRRVVLVSVYLWKRAALKESLQ